MIGPPPPTQPGGGWSLPTTYGLTQWNLYLRVCERFGQSPLAMLDTPAGLLSSLVEYTLYREAEESRAHAAGGGS